MFLLLHPNLHYQAVGQQLHAPHLPADRRAAGCGLMKYGSALAPFVNRFPKDTELYRFMTTRPGEGVFGGEKRQEASVCVP